MIEDTDQTQIEPSKDEKPVEMTAAELKKFNTTAPGGEVPPSVRARMSEEALAVETNQLSFSDYSKIALEAAYRQQRGEVEEAAPAPPPPATPSTVPPPPTAAPWSKGKGK